jgi:hypothetical protein
MDISTTAPMSHVFDGWAHGLNRSKGFSLDTSDYRFEVERAGVWVVRDKYRGAIAQGIVEDETIVIEPRHTIDRELKFMEDYVPKGGDALQEAKFDRRVTRGMKAAGVATST